MAIACGDASNHFHKRCVAKSGGEVEQVDVAALQVGTVPREREERERAVTRGGDPLKSEKTY